VKKVAQSRPCSGPPPPAGGSGINLAGEKEANPPLSGEHSGPLLRAKTPAPGNGAPGHPLPEIPASPNHRAKNLGMTGHNLYISRHMKAYAGKNNDSEGCIAFTAPSPLRLMFYAAPFHRRRRPISGLVL